MTKDKADRTTCARFDYLGNVMFHACKAVRSLECAKDNLLRTNQYTAALPEFADVLNRINAGIASAEAAQQYALNERITLQQTFSL